MKLICKTRGNASPQGKPRVYFTGHPKDLAAYLEEVSDDIFQLQNCAIYYDAEPISAADQDDLRRELEQMQLFVIPVTSRFLYQPNRARDVEFPLAMERHIPVLPLLQEEGLESAFNEQCGDLQMLNKGDPDPTALPYTEKLEKFLASVLVGDELAEKVRAAFDAYVFLSYRKKDRRYAQELMRLIHKNDFCRDIAIWYDEFLTPGENFNDAIADALGKCSLFALAVTPNVVEPGNYVMTLEYPEAKKSGKPILPVEVVPTSKWALWRNFKGLPRCARADREAELSSALLEAVQKLAIRANDGSPKHNFFIGLAYLNGIDVEVNRERALSLITGAAEDGLPEAMEKLVRMYRSGDGVQRDYRAAIGWQEKLISLWQARYERHSSEKDGVLWGLELCSLGDYLWELADLAAAERAYETMQLVCKELEGRCGNVTARKYYAISYEKLGNVSRAKGHLAEAKEYYLRGLELNKQLCEETGTVQAQLNLSLSYDNLGNISRREGDLARAKEYYLRGLELIKPLCKEAGTVRARRDLAVSYDNLGNISQEEGNLAMAKDYYLRGLELDKLLFEETGTVQARQDLAASYSHLGNISQAEGDLAKAKDYYLRGLELGKQLYEETGTVQAQRNLSVNYNELGSISQAEGDLAGAKECYLHGLELRSRLFEETGTVQARRDLSASYNKLGNISQAEGDLAGAKDYYLRGLELDKPLYEETGTVEARRDLAVSYHKLGDINRAEGDLAGAKDCYLRGLELVKQLCSETGTVEARQDLSIVYERLGSISQAEGDLAGAKDYFLRSLKLTKQLCDEIGTVQARRSLSISYDRLGDISWAEGDLAGAKDYFLRGMELRRQLYEEIGTVEARQNLSVSYNSLRDISMAMDDLDEAMGYYLRRMELDE